MKKWLLALVSVFVLAACGDKEEEVSTREVIEEGTVGFEIAGGNIKEAADIPEDVKKEVVAAFDEYIAAFNAGDIDRYAATTARNAKGFDYEADLVEAKKVFDNYTVNRQAEDVTIVKYNESEAQVYANLSISMTEKATNTPISSNGRQVTVFVNENDAWKVSSVHYIENQ